MDGLTGCPEAIASIFPDTDVQLCIVDRIGKSLRYVASKNHEAFLADLNRVYRARTLSDAVAVLDELESVWAKNTRS